MQDWHVALVLHGTLSPVPMEVPLTGSMIEEQPGVSAR